MFAKTHRMTLVSKQSKHQPSSGVWSISHRILVSVPIFVILMGLFATVSRLTTVPWQNEPTNQSMSTQEASTAVTFDNPDHLTLPKGQTYKITQHHATLTVTQSSTGDKQRMGVLVREPVGASGARPAVVFMHGAGDAGKAEDSFGDVASQLASAGFVTLVPDKPTWRTSSFTRDYAASAQAYLQAVNYLRKLPQVDANNVGLYAISESTWISSLMLQEDHGIAFQILLSPMVFTPRQSLGFFVAQDVVMIGANSGYQSMVRRIFSIDFDHVGLHNADYDPSRPRAYAVPTFVAYGAEDVMTAQVEGVRQILARAAQSGNRDVTVRTYAKANHVIRVGDQSLGGTPLAAHFLDDITDWTVGETSGLQQTSKSMAGPTIHQSVAVPLELHSHRTLTWYMIVLHVAAILGLVVSTVTWIVALVWKIGHHIKGLRGTGTALGYQYGFGGVLLWMALTTVITVLLFAAGLGQVIAGVTVLCWGGDPGPAGLAFWSWPVIQLMCTAVIWTWSRVTARIMEVSSMRGVSWIFPLNVFRRGRLRRRGEPVVATTRLGRFLFAVTALAMFLVLLVFAFWGLFIY